MVVVVLVVVTKFPFGSRDDEVVTVGLLEEDTPSPFKIWFKFELPVWLDIDIELLPPCCTPPPPLAPEFSLIIDSLFCSLFSRLSVLLTMDPPEPPPAPCC